MYGKCKDPLYLAAGERGWGGVNGKGVRGREGGRIQEGGKANKLEQGAK